MRIPLPIRYLNSRQVDVNELYSERDVCVRELRGIVPYIVGQHGETRFDAQQVQRRRELSVEIERIETEVERLIK